MHKVLLLLAVVYAAQASASQFENIKAMYARGSLPKVSDVVGWRVGRCFFPDDPDKAYGGVFFGVTGMTGKKGDLKILLGPPREYDSPETVWDNPKTETIQYLQETVVDRYYEAFTSVAEKDRSLFSHFPGKNSDYHIRLAPDGTSYIGVVITNKIIRAACRFTQQVK